MSNIKIFRANRGEGKTKWLADRIKECADSGLDVYYIGWASAGRKLYYVGGELTFDGLKRVYESIYHERCPVKFGIGDDVDRDYCFFTDEFIDNTRAIVKFKPFIVEKTL